MKNILNNFKFYSFNPIFLTGFSFAGTVLSVVIENMGGWDNWLKCLVSFMAVDFIMGLYTALKGKSSKSEDGRPSSKACIDGIFKKAAILGIVFIIYQLELAAEIEHIRNGIIIAFIVGEGISIKENWELLGYDLPEKFKEILDVIKNKKD